MEDETLINQITLCPMGKNCNFTLENKIKDYDKEE